MLKNVDRVFAWLVWLAAGAIVVMLLVGPQVVAEDKAKVTYNVAPGAIDGKTIFVARCGSCHTLGTAGTNGQVGPALDGISLDASQVQAIVRSGRGGMPAFGGQLSDAEIAAVAKLVAGSS